MSKRVFHPIERIKVEKINQQYHVTISRTGRKSKTYYSVRGGLYAFEHLDRIIIERYSGLHLSVRLTIFPEIFLSFKTPKVGCRREHAGPAVEDRSKRWIKKPFPRKELEEA